MKRILVRPIIIFSTICLVIACATTKHVPDGKYLLRGVSVNIDDKRVSTRDAESFVKQKANSRTFGLFPLYLWVYNISGTDSTKTLNKFFRNWGEAPVLYDSVKTQRTEVQLKRFMENKGFYNVNVVSQKKFKGKKVKIQYQVTAGEPKLIDKIILHKDSLLYKVIGRKNMAIELADTTEQRRILFGERNKKILKPEGLLDVDNLKKERQYLEKLYKSKAYYNFEQDNIHFYLDTTKSENKADIYYGLRAEDLKKLRKYKLRRIVLHLDIDARKKAGNTDIDSLSYEGITIVYKGKLAYKPSVLRRAVVLNQGDLYSPAAIEETKERLSILQQFRYTNITFKEIPNKDKFGALDCYVLLGSRKRQSYGVEVTGTLNSGDLGFATNLKYEHKNLFRGAELLRLQLSAGMERVNHDIQIKNFNAKEFGGVVSLVTPKFFLPFLKAKNWRAKAPRTSFALSYNYAKRPEYKRTITDLTFSYQWRSGRNFTHKFTPVDLGILKVNADESFLNKLNDYYRRTSYVDHIIPSSRYTLYYNNQGKTQKTTYQRGIFRLELAGNTLNTIDRFLDRDDKDIDVTDKKYFSYFGIRYAQFVRADMDVTYNHFLNKDNAFVYHLFLGAGLPYGNSNVMPFEKMYFAGGSNSMRAWNPRSLGPGASKNREPGLHLSYGEMKLEGNFEYRFSMGGNLEGALFVDAGNVWNISKATAGDVESQFQWKTFHEQLAVGSGLGIRYNVSNIILRLDAAVKVIDPSLKENSFVPENRLYNFDDITFNFGIGYPF